LELGAPALGPFFGMRTDAEYRFGPGEKMWTRRASRREHDDVGVAFPLSGVNMQSLLPCIQRLARALDRLDDAELLAAFLQCRDEAAFALLVHRHGPLVYGVCRRWLRETADIEDAFQATFLVLVRRAGSISRPQQLANWLYGVALRAARKQRERTRRIRQHEVPATDLSARFVTVPERDLELGMTLDAELRRLPEKYRLPILLCHGQGLSRREAAAIIGCPEGTLSVRLARAVRRLRRRLTEAGLAPAAVTALTPIAAKAVPPDLVRSTLRMAVPYLLQPGSVTARAALLAEGVVQMLWVRRFSLALASVFVVAALGAGTGLFLRQSASVPLHAQAPLPEKKPAPATAALTVRVQTDEAGAVRQMVVAEDGDEISVATTRALGRYLKRTRRDLPAATELTVLIERRIRPDALQRVAAACLDAGFAHCQVKSTDGRPIALVPVGEAGAERATEAAMSLSKALNREWKEQDPFKPGSHEFTDALAKDIAKAQAAHDEQILAARDWLKKRQEYSAKNSDPNQTATAVALLALGEAMTRDPMDGVWQATELQIDGRPIPDRKALESLEWIIVGDFLIHRPHGEYCVAKIRRESKNGFHRIEIHQEGEEPADMSGLYSLTGDVLKIVFPLGAGVAGEKKEVSVTFQRKKADASAAPRR
jgi:RNA polymerase sigma-70 factor (ECF subfamily)